MIKGPRERASGAEQAAGKAAKRGREEEGGREGGRLKPTHANNAIPIWKPREEREGREREL